MPDWKRIVQEQLGLIDSDSSQREEIVSELACHLEDVYEDQLARGCAQSEAMASALDQVVGGRKVGRRIQNSKEGEMNDRTRKFWLPGFISLASATLFLMILAKISYEPRVILLRSSFAVMVYPVWLAGQPVFGALGAYFCRRGGGKPWARVAAGLFPSLVLTAGICIVLVIQAVETGLLGAGRMDFSMPTRAVLGAIVIPSVALFAGVLPFLKERKNQGLAGN